MQSARHDERLLPAGILTSYPHHDDAVRRGANISRRVIRRRDSVSAVCPAPSRKSARRGAPTSLHCRRFPTQGILATDDGHPPRRPPSPVDFYLSWMSPGFRPTFQETSVILSVLIGPTRLIVMKNSSGSQGGRRCCQCDAGHFSKSVRSGAPQLFPPQRFKKTSVILSALIGPTRQVRTAIPFILSFHLDILTVARDDRVESPPLSRR
jgi:hypothetical protein